MIEQEKKRKKKGLGKKGLEKIHSLAIKRFDEAQFGPDHEQRTLAIDDMLFVHKHDGQWDDIAVSKRKGRPMYTIDRISSAIDQVVGDHRQSKIGIKIIPQKDGTAKTARILTGLIRNIEQNTEGINAYDNAFREIVEGGFGGWRVYADHENDASFDLELGIEPILSAASTLFFDPDAVKDDRSDADYAFVSTKISFTSFRNKWPKASTVGIDDPKSLAESKAAWFNNEQETVQLAEYWYKEPIIKTIALLSDGRVIDFEEEKEVLDELEMKGIIVEETREVSSHKIFSLIMNGVEILEGPTEWIGKYIPLVPVFGKTASINRKFFSRGVVRKAIDSQRVYNYATSAGIEATALTPKDPYFITPTQIEGHEDQYKNFPTTNDPFMVYNPDPQAPGPPSRGGAPQVQSALLQQISQAANDIYSTTGLEPVSLGSVPELKSEKAIANQQKMGDRGVFVFRDNLTKGVAHTGRILVDLIPRIYDTERVVQILGEDDETITVVLNERKFDELNDPIIDRQTGKQVIVNDLSQGRYGVIAKAGPSYATKRAETVDNLMTLAGQSEMVQQLALDIIIKNLDLNYQEELYRRVRKALIKQGTVDPTPEEIKEFGLDKPPKEDPLNIEILKNLQAQTEKILIDNQKTISEIEKTDHDSQAKIMETQNKSLDSLVKAIDIIVKKKENGLPLTERDLMIVLGQQALVEETQGDVIAGGELAGSAPLGRP